METLLKNFKDSYGNEKKYLQKVKDLNSEIVNNAV